MKTWTFAAVVASSLSLVAGTRVAAPWAQCGGIDFEPVACPEGYRCDTVNSQYSQCIQSNDVSTPESDSDDTHELLRRQSGNIPVTGATVGGVVSRRSIYSLPTEEPDTYNMFIWALYVLERVPESDPGSYYQISGIHGRPNIAWGQEPAGSERLDTGYCTHRSVLFATWHRPYLALIEQRISAIAVSEAAKFTGPQAGRWRTAATRVRLPYWDWARDNSILPPVATRSRIPVTRPAQNGGAPTQVTIDNPLYQYRFTNAQFMGRYFDPEWAQKPVTLRAPINTVTSNNNQASSNMASGYSARRDQVRGLFSITSMNSFSSNDFQQGGNGGPPQEWTSLESIHNEVHVMIGGTQQVEGHMSGVSYSAFDPIFWLHHCNVDRLFAMWQAVYPNARVNPADATDVYTRSAQPGVQDTINTPLWPFRHPNNQFFTSNDVISASSTWNLGYAYPEVPSSFRGRSASEFRTFVIGRVNALYGPTSADANRKRADTSTRREWICHFTFIPSEVDHVISIDIYFDTDGRNNGTKGYRVGSGAALHHTHYSEYSKNKRISAAVPLTTPLLNAGIDVNDKKAVVGYLRKNLNWYMRKGPNDRYDLQDIPSLMVAVSSSLVTYKGTHELPDWDEAETYYEITERKTCGMGQKDNSLVGSKDAERYFDRNA